MSESRLTTTFKNLKQAKRKALITFVVAGDPTPEATPQLIETLFSSGSDIVEIGIPFSDPASEGPTIRKANERAMIHNITIEQVLAMVTELRCKTQKPLVLLTYFNPVFRYGPERFVKDCVQAGVDGVIIPDLPYEERDEVAQFSAGQPFDLITMYSPLSSNRAERLIEKAEGFLYCISSVGTTGVREHLETNFADLMVPLNSRPDLPRAIGFGVSTPSQASALKHHADGIIIGSAIVDRIAPCSTEDIKKSLNDCQATISEFVTSIRAALDETDSKEII